MAQFTVHGTNRIMPGPHNNIWCPTYLGTSLTSAQSTEIRNGTFNGLYLGSYWTINGVNWRIMGFDTYYRCGDTSLGTHHVVVVPDTNLYNCKWNDTNNTVTGGPSGGAGYVNSLIRANIKSSTNGSAEGAQLKVIAAFGDSHVLSYRALYPNGYNSSGVATGWAWVDARVELMNETLVYGHHVWGNNGFEDGIDKLQLPGFAMNPQLLNIRAGCWLRSVSSASNACFVDGYGAASRTGASISFGVRPLSLIA